MCNIEQEHHLGTSISGWGRALLLALQSIGVDGRKIFIDCGLDPDAQSLPFTRNPVAKMQHVWQIAETSVEDWPLLVERTVQHLNASSFYALGFGLYASQSVEDLFQRLSRYREVCSSSVNISTIKDKRTCTLVVNDLRQVASHTTTDVFVLFIFKVCRELGGANFAPTKINLPWPEQQYKDSIRNFINVPFAWNTKNYAIEFQLSDIQRPLPGANTQLAGYQDSLCRDYLRSLNEHEHLPYRVKLKIMQTLGSAQFNIDYIAGNLNMSPRTLQRKLKVENTGFRALVEEARRELVESYIQNRELSATQISYMLGFSNLPSFSSSFKGWYGKSFSEYRNNHLSSRASG